VKTEWICCAAIEVTEKDDSKTVLWGFRHNDCIPHAIRVYGPEGWAWVRLKGRYTQGFVTSTNRYVGREEAFDLASAAGQLLDPEFPIQLGTLYSEDIY
jgi:hypothetical protein